MVVCIVTVYNSINCGSYLQAYALGEAIRQIGHDVVYWKRERDRDSSAALTNKIKATLGCTISGGFPCALRYIRGLKEFSFLQKTLKVTMDKESVDCFVLGSDTIWNLGSKYFQTHYRIYWGIEFLPKKVISYAASVANTPAKAITKEMIDAVNQFRAVSVRDQYTYELIKEKTDADIHIVCDPTLLLTKEMYQKNMLKRRDYHYVYLYLFESLDEVMAKELKQFCQKHHLKIINGCSPKKPSYCDEASVVAPYHFLTDLYYADYVITDTFHGTIFSILFNKQFASLDRGKNKVENLLVSFGLIKRLTKSDLAVKLPQPIDYDVVNGRLKEIREASVCYLKDNLGLKQE